MNTWVSKGEYNLTTEARWAVVGRNKQIDEGADRQTWKYIDPLNCIIIIIIILKWTLL